MTVEINKELLDKCLQQDTRAEYTLYNICFQTLMSISRRYTRNDDDSADLVNKGFYKILTNLSKYDAQRPFQKWIATIMMNTVIDEFRSNKTYKTLIQHTDIYPVEHGTQLDVNTAEAKLEAQDIYRYIGKLPDASKMVLNMYVFEGMTHKEIADALSISEGTSKWHLSNARNMLKQMIKKAMETVRVITL
jgi:RNA polymerase sigma factor (sigma-70 family)